MCNMFRITCQLIVLLKFFAFAVSEQFVYPIVYWNGTHSAGKSQLLQGCIEIKFGEKLLMDNSLETEEANEKLGYGLNYKSDLIEQKLLTDNSPKTEEANEELRYGLNYKSDLIGQKLLMDNLPKTEEANEELEYGLNYKSDLRTDEILDEDEIIFRKNDQDNYFEERKDEMNFFQLLPNWFQVALRTFNFSIFQLNVQMKLVPQNNDVDIYKFSLICLITLITTTIIYCCTYNLSPSNRSDPCDNRTLDDDADGENVAAETESDKKRIRRNQKLQTDEATSSAQQPTASNSVNECNFDQKKKKKKKKKNRQNKNMDVVGRIDETTETDEIILNDELPSTSFSSWLMKFYYEDKNEISDSDDDEQQLNQSSEIEDEPEGQLENEPVEEEELEEEAPATTTLRNRIRRRCGRSSRTPESLQESLQIQERGVGAVDNSKKSKRKGRRYHRKRRTH